jgi:hypothetical protein
MQSLVNFAHAVGETITPVLTESAFMEKGVMTPDEFVAAGDKLVALCGTWQWCAPPTGPAIAARPAAARCRALTRRCLALRAQGERRGGATPRLLAGGQAVPRHEARCEPSLCTACAAALATMLARCVLSSLLNAGPVSGAQSPACSVCGRSRARRRPCR